MTICNAIADMMYTEYHEPQSVKQNEVQELSIAIAELPTPLQMSHEELTPTEISNCAVQLNIGKAMILRLQQSLTPTSLVSLNDKASFDASAQHIQDWLNDTARQQSIFLLQHSIRIGSEIPIAPSWQYLHSTFSTLESLQFIPLFLALQAKSSKAKTKSKSKNPGLVLSADQQKSMLDLVLQIETSLHDSARTLKTNLTAAGVLGRMIDVVFGRIGDDAASGDDGGLGVAFGRELEQLPGAETVAERFCGEVKESWEEALEGVLAVRVRRWK